MQRFGIIGVAGYIAPRHLQAIKETKNKLVVGMDISDSVGVMDTYFPEAEFFTEFASFEEFLEDERIAGRKLDFITICSPNYLHVPHIKCALKNGINVICEKPLVLNSADLDLITEYERNYGASVNSILQLRLHPTIQQLKLEVEKSNTKNPFDVDLTYITSRGKWYSRSWKGDEYKSGGVAANIGVHFFDMLHYIFGEIIDTSIQFRDEQTCSGFTKYEKANVSWFLSINSEHLPENPIKGEKLTHRSIKIAGKEIEFSGGFTDLHTVSYEQILSGNGFSVRENRPAILTVENIRTARIDGSRKRVHPLLKRLVR